MRSALAFAALILLGSCSSDGGAGSASEAPTRAEEGESDRRTAVFKETEESLLNVQSCMEDMGYGFQFELDTGIGNVSFTTSRDEGSDVGDADAAEEQCLGEYNADTAIAAFVSEFQLSDEAMQDRFDLAATCLEELGIEVDRDLGLPEAILVVEGEEEAVDDCLLSAGL